ncbi:MAG: hypothetical protein GXP17_07760 [Gammaproteobacteria bacterium]|nr:hypothetical protein [Gammaproteobacteria bacterium]
MPLLRNNFFTLATLLGAGVMTLAFSVTPAWARDGIIPHYAPLDFSLSLEKSDLNLRNSDRRFFTRVERISVTFLEAPGPSLQYGVSLGSSYVELDNDPLSEGLRPSGYHLGMSIHRRLVSRPEVSLSLRYLYQEVKDETAMRTTTVSWHEWESEAVLRLRASQRWRLVIGGGFAGIDARRRVRGSSNDTLQLEPLSGAQGRVGLELRESASGHVALVLRRGVFNGVKLVFSRRF